MTTKRELTVLHLVAEYTPDPVTPRQLASLLGLGISRAREVANHLTGRGMLSKGRVAFGPGVDYTITDAGRRELNGDG